MPHTSPITKLPWRAKLFLKVLAGSLPISYGFLRRVGLGRHGRMESAEYARAVVAEHLAKCGLVDGPFRALELGPGDSLASAIVARALGSRETVLVDVGRFASEDLALYRSIAAQLEGAGLEVPDLSGASTLDAVCNACNARYLTDGVTSLRSLPDSRYDAVWSHAVLEHVRAEELEDVLAETFRLLRPGGRASHRVDLQDHLAGSLNNMRFSSGVWESRFIRRSGAYTNRVSSDAYRTIAERVGFDVIRFDVERWAALPVPRQELAAPFASRSDDELTVRAFDLVVERPA